MEGWREFELVAVVLLQGPPGRKLKSHCTFPAAAITLLVPILNTAGAFAVLSFRLLSACPSCV